ncbi:MAG: Gfo/Idh/MocA family oxidoreductase [Candidatus Nealsonbacteria bacterium]|nr:Gfo/Idh/MocA family oxidoreductase [Candidatus Nealsonbacteria bacterium]
MTDDDRNYSLAAPSAGKQIPAPNLPYRPRDPKTYQPEIGLIACGGITEDHLTAYRAAGYRVTALCDPVVERAEKRRTEFYLDAKVFRDYRDLLELPDVEVVDLAAHPQQRAAMIEDALQAGKHVLSQKPFVLDLDLGQRMVELADRQGVRLAVNQNGRWAPHFSYLREAIAAGLLGGVMAVHASVHWDHSWVKGTDFEKIHHLILYDFAVHWFDIVTCFLGERPARQVYASTVRSPAQDIDPPLLAQAVIEYDDAQASLAFDAHTRLGTQDRTYIVGSDGTAVSTGPDLKQQTVTLYTSEGHAKPELTGCWFPDGFHGTMGELLSAIEEGREPIHSARNNLRTLELCFAAVASAERHEPVIPGTVRTMP